MNRCGHELAALGRPCREVAVDLSPARVLEVIECLGSCFGRTLDNPFDARVYYGMVG